MRLGVFAIAFVFLATQSALAQTPSDALNTCLAPLRENVARAGGVTDAIGARFFLREGESRSSLQRFESADCVGFFALGQRGARDLDLFLSTDSGILLVQDVREDAHPYVRYCGGAGLTVYVTARMYQGQGEVEIVRIDHAPQNLGDVDAMLGECVVPIGGAHNERPDLGNEPRALTTQEMLAAQRNDFLARGYRHTGQVRTGHVEVGRDATLPVQLPFAACYGAAIQGDASIGSFQVGILNEGRVPLAYSNERGVSAQLDFCMTRPGTPEIIVSTSRGSGDFVVEFFQLDERGISVPVGIDGVGRVNYIEAFTKMRSFGAQATPLAWVYLAPRDEARFPFSTHAGSCYQFSAAGASEVANGGYSLLLTDASGNVLQRDLNNARTPLLHHCATRDERVVLVVARGPGNAGRVLMLVGESRPIQGTP